LRALLFVISLVLIEVVRAWTIAITLEKAKEIASALSESHPKSPMALIFHAVEALRVGDSSQAS
jgi:hypothetical protein